MAVVGDSFHQRLSICLLFCMISQKPYDILQNRCKLDMEMLHRKS